MKHFARVSVFIVSNFIIVVVLRGSDPYQGFGLIKWSAAFGLGF